MTKSPPAKKTIPRPKPRPPISVMVLSVLFRLLLLTVGSGLAWIVGIAIAQVYPSTRSEPPLVEKLFDRAETGKRERLGVSSSVSETPAASPTPADLAPQIPLSAQERQQLQTQLQQLQQQLNTLLGRTAALETQLGISRPSETLEKRLQIIERQLSTETGGASGSTPTDVEPARRSSPSEGLVVTLPSDILFETNTNSLRPGASVILDTLIADLENYKGAAVRVAGHSDNTGNPQDNLSLSLQQAEAIIAYLSAAVGSEYHWVAIGYGGGQPTVENDSTTQKQLNRRIEVAIAPQTVIRDQ